MSSGAEPCGHFRLLGRHQLGIEPANFLQGVDPHHRVSAAGIRLAYRRVPFLFGEPVVEGRVRERLEPPPARDRRFLVRIKELDRLGREVLDEPAIAVEEQDIAAFGKVLPKGLETGVAAPRGIERPRPVELDDDRASQALREFDLTERVWAKIAERSADKREPTYFRAQAIAWKADARRELLDLSGALEERRREIQVYREMLIADGNDSKAKEGLAVAQYRLAQLQLETGSSRQAAATAGQSFETIRKLQTQDASNRLWQEIAIKAANIRTEALIIAREWAEARQANRWALDNATKLVRLDSTVTNWRTDCLLPARWMQIAISSGAKDQPAVRQQIAQFDRNFSWDPAGKASEEERFAWVMVDVLEGVHWRSAGENSKARESFARAASRLPTDHLNDPRLLAVASYLNRNQGIAGLPQVAPATASRVRYDVGALLNS